MRRYIPGRRVQRGVRQWGVDWVNVDRACAGEPPATLTTEELTVAVRQLDGYRMSATQIAVRLGVSQRTAQRHRARHRARHMEVAS